MEMAKVGKYPEWLKNVAKSEGIELDKLVKLIAKGEVVVPKNIDRELKYPKAIGRFVSTKINANVGTSIDYIDVDDEVEKAKIAQKYGADAIMDLSTAGDLNYIRRRLLDVTEVPFGTVPIYQSARMKKVVVDMDEDDFFKSVEIQAKDGVDFMTIHAGINKFTLDILKKSDRLLGVVSRGGAIIVGWMVHNEKENPYYKDFDYLLEILKEYDVTISLGDALRPGCLHDSDRAKYAEWIVLGELVEKCREKGVQCIVEGPGHMPADQIASAVKAMKVITKNAPLYLLGPLITDIALGYDHIAGAMGALIAGMAGADFICYLTPAEHLALPTVEDVKEGVIVTKIAAHAIDLIKEGVKDKARRIDYEMSLARKNFNWRKQFKLAINGERAKNIWKRRKSKFACSMCGDLCAIKIAQEALERNVFNSKCGQSES